jgi:cysteine desulfurase
MTARIHLDHATSTPLSPEILDAMVDALGITGSPDALYTEGAAASRTLADARANVAALIGADPDEVIFTAGPTEARNLAVKGLLSANSSLGRHAVASAIEHPAVMSALRSHARDGGETTFVGVGPTGIVDPAALARAVTNRTAVVSVHHAQHEIGTIQDIAALIAAVRDRRSEARIHVDAAESIGTRPIDVHRIGADAVSIGGTALGAPAWTGALWIRPGARLHPLIEGGAQEGGKRAGAVDLAGAVALGRCADIRRRNIDLHATRLAGLTRRLADLVLAVPDVRLNGPEPGARLPGHLQVSVLGITGESLALSLATRGVDVAPGSTCTADAGKASPTLEAIGCGPDWTHAAILMTIGAATTRDEISRAGAAFAQAVADLRATSPVGR